jgi:hypothetical protein
VLTAEQKVKYDQIREMAVSELHALDQTIAAELARVKKRLLELQEERKAVKQILDGASTRLGMPRSPDLGDISLADLSRFEVAAEPAARS